MEGKDDSSLMRFMRAAVTLPGKPRPDSIQLKAVPDLADNLQESDLLIKSVHLAYFRMAFAMVSLAVGGLVWVLTRAEIEPTGFFVMTACVVAYSLAALILIKQKVIQADSELANLNAVLIALDIYVLSALVHYTKGVDSDLYFLYLLPILLASYTFGRRGIFATAFAVSCAYIATLLAENLSFLPYLTGAQYKGLAAAYSQRLWMRVLTRSTILVSVAYIWAAFCQHMSQVAQQSAIRLRGQLDANNRLVDETRAQAAREQLINTIGSAIRSTLNLESVFATTVFELGSALHSNRCAIITAGENIGEPPGLWEAFSRLSDGGSKPLLSTEACQFLLERKSHYEEDATGGIQKTFVIESPANDPELAEIKAELSALKLFSLIIQPIIYGGESKGILLIGDGEHGRTWTASELELIKSVAGQVAIAIEHSRLVDQLSRKNRDLLTKNLHLDAKNLELREVQSQMIHQEKMASLGRMVAGIAHELNNPVNFVHGNLPYLRQYFEDMKAVIKSIDEIPPEFRSAADELKTKVKYEFLLSDLDNILADLSEGSERIRQIIRNLRSFSRLDEAELKEASIQEGIESTIKILNQYYGRDKIPVETQFADLPPVLCYPGKLNQVWMNLLSNAAQAVSEVDSPLVRVTTELEDEWAIVSIADNGPGIKPQDQSKIFEPFYTTKPVGQGTGLGLSICHSIIERHGGTIWFQTGTGTGTTFKVKIPLKSELPSEPIDEREITTNLGETAG
jgi:signal transduction histidine kinase